MELHAAHNRANCTTVQRRTPPDIGEIGDLDAAVSRPAQPRVSVVIPTLNEARNLEVLLPQLPDVAEVVLVDGNSVDDTVEVARRLVPDVRVVRQTRKGKGNALVCGIEAATGDVVVTLDADCSALPEEIPAFVGALTDGADYAKGTRYAHGGGSADLTPLRRFGNAGLNLLANTALGTKYSDLCYGYNAFWADVVPSLDLPPANTGSALPVWGDGFEIETLLCIRAVRAGLNITEVPSFEANREFGTSNLRTTGDGLRVLRTIVAEARRAPLRAS